MGVRAIAVGLLAAAALAGLRGGVRARPPPRMRTPGRTTTTSRLRRPSLRRRSRRSSHLRPRRPAPIAFGVTVGGVSRRRAPAVPGAERREEGIRPPAPARREPHPEVPTLAPATLGASANIPKAIRRARVARPGSGSCRSTSRSRPCAIRKYVERLARELDREAVGREVVLRGATSARAIPSQVGRRLKRLASARAIRVALKRNARAPIPLSFEVLKPQGRDRRARRRGRDPSRLEQAPLLQPDRSSSARSASRPARRRSRRRSATTRS